MSFPNLCLNCSKYFNQTIVLACESCNRFQFPENILCDLARMNIEIDTFTCKAFKPKLSVVQKGEKLKSDSNDEFEKTKTRREKWIVSYILQQHKLKPDQVQFKLQYHLVLLTKNRNPLFSDLYFQSFSEIFSRATRSYSYTDVDVIWLATDHIHLYLNTTPDYAIDEIIKAIVKNSEFEIINRYPEFQNEYENIWNHEFFVETVG